MDKIKGQASKVGELLFDSETGATYKRTIALTWAILRETGVLLWLVICLVFVGGEWFWYKSIALGKSTRHWYEDLKEPSDTEPKSASDIGESALAAIGSGAGNLLYQAKKQLGIDAEPPAPRPKTPKTQAPASSVSEPVESTSSATSAPEPTKPTNSALGAAAAEVSPEPTPAQTAEPMGTSGSTFTPDTVEKVVDHSELEEDS